MANYLFEVVRVFESWVGGRDLSGDEVYFASSLLGSPTRRLEVFLERYRGVVGQVIEERCCDAGGGRMCIYSWSRRAFKRYFPAALDAGGTIIFYGAGGPALASYPLHRAFDLGVRGVEVPGEGPSFATPRIDGWQVNLYWDPALGRWAFSTRYVLHNMAFVRGDLKVEDYGLTINPVVAVAERVSERLGLWDRLGEFKGWTLTLMIEGPEPATLVGGPPPMDYVESYRLILVAAREPDGTLLDPLTSSGIAEKLGVESMAGRVLGISGDMVDYGRGSVEHPSIFLWYLGRGDREHPEIYEVKSELYEDYVKASKAMDARSFALLLTSESKLVIEKLREALGEKLVDETLEALRKLEEALKETVERGEVEPLKKALRRKSVKADVIASAVKSLGEGKHRRALRILLASILEGWRVEDASLIISGLADDIRLSLG
ncbi:MAG: hypothetical protein P3X22_007450 [Thermoprotei archaeon]|nr:hypothetical protein [Thermoprotei archaeon]